MKEVVIVNPVRTAIGTFRRRAADRAGLRSGQDRHGMRHHAQPASIPRRSDEVIFGNIGQPSEAANIARVSALYAGIPQQRARLIPSSATALRLCRPSPAPTSAIQAGDGEIFLVGGTENMSKIPYVIKGARWGLQLRHARADRRPVGRTDRSHLQPVMGGTAENLAESTASAARSRTSSRCRATRRRSWPPAWASSRTRSCRSK